MEVGYGLMQAMGMALHAGGDGESRWESCCYRLLARPAAFCRIPVPSSLWVSEWGTSWTWNYWFGGSHRSGSRWGARSSLGHRRVAGRRRPRPRGGDERICVRVSVILPTYNEAQAIGRVLADLPSHLVTEVIVVDSNSD